MVLVRFTRRQFIGAAGAFALTSGLTLPARGVTINPRASWATDRPPKGPLAGEDVRFLIVHHSASQNGHTGADAPAILRGFFDYHTSPEKGWNDIAYNFLIDSDGGIWEGRAGSLDGPVAGDATGGNQGFSQLVCIIGDYNLVQPSQASLSSLVALLAWLGDRYGVSTSPGAEVAFASRGSNRHPSGTDVTTPTITGHRSMSQTTCPGENLNAYVVGGLMADVEAFRGGSAPPAPNTSTSTTTTTTTQPPTTTTSMPTTTTIPPTTTTVPASTTTIPEPTTTTLMSTTTPSSPAPPTTVIPSTALPVAAATLPVGSSTPTGIIATGAAFIATGAGLLVWRHKRMGGGSGQ